MELLNTFIDFKQGNPLKKSYEWRTDVVCFDSGLEQRNQILTSPIRHWFLNWPMLPKGNRDKLIELFQRGQGRYKTFRYEDSDDKQASCSFTQTKYDITAVDTSAETFTIAGNHADKFATGVKFAVEGSTGNDGDWTVSSSANSGSNTIITVTGNITDATADGRILPKQFQLFATYYSGESESWNEDRKDIKPDSVTGTKGSTSIVEDTDFTLDDTTGIIIFKDGKAPQSIDVKTADAGANTFTVEGDVTGDFATGDKFKVTGSTGNDGTYTITNISYSSPDTTITVANVPDGTDDGVINQLMQFTFNYYFRVRFNFDAHTDSMIQAGMYSGENLEIIEVKS